MQHLTYQYLSEEQPRYIITDPEGEHCKGCGAPLRAGPEHCQYCNRPAISEPMREYVGARR